MAKNTTYPQPQRWYENHKCTARQTDEFFMQGFGLEADKFKRLKVDVGRVRAIVNPDGEYYRGAKSDLKEKHANLFLQHLQEFKNAPDPWRRDAICALMSKINTNKRHRKLQSTSVEKAPALPLSAPPSLAPNLVHVPILESALQATEQETPPRLEVRRSGRVQDNYLKPRGSIRINFVSVDKEGIQCILGYALLRHLLDDAGLPSWEILRAELNNFPELGFEKMVYLSPSEDQQIAIRTEIGWRSALDLLSEKETYLVQLTTVPLPLAPCPSSTGSHKTPPHPIPTISPLSVAPRPPQSCPHLAPPHLTLTSPPFVTSQYPSSSSRLRKSKRKLSLEIDSGCVPDPKRARNNDSFTRHAAEDAPSNGKDVAKASSLAECITTATTTTTTTTKSVPKPSTPKESTIPTGVSFSFNLECEKNSRDPIADCILAFDNALRNSLDAEEYAHKRQERSIVVSGVPIYLRDVERLRTSQWLNDSIIDVLLNSEQQQQPAVDRCYTDCASLMIWTSCADPIANLEKDLERANNNTLQQKRYPFKRLSTSQDCVLFAFNPSGTHWVAVEISNSKEPKICVFDSWSSNQHELTHTAAKIQLPLLAALGGKRQGTKFSNVPWTTVEVTKAYSSLQAREGNDCGLFTIFAISRRMQKFSAALDPTPKSVVGRKRMGRWLRETCARRLQALLEHELYHSPLGRTLADMFTDSNIPNFDRVGSTRIG